MEILNSLGYDPWVDEDGNVCLCHQLKIIVFKEDTDSDSYVAAYLCQFSKVPEGKDTLMLAICNRVNQETRQAKVFIDQTSKMLSACCEFYYTNTESLMFNLLSAMKMLGMARHNILKIWIDQKFRSCVKGRI